ncbi:hypothetical protein BLD33_02035 [Campylobacter coli]|uniref:DUF2920 family protein n=1 Tax=Campylobacter coli TaxID=195 RepID=UPI0008F4F88B|nr:DUF2920 family protein [Campylobacter coli]APA57272.1 hypothetical protein BLD33_02035 [Campylobacter coli]
MLINQTFEIDSCDDVELGIKRTSKLEYRISYDDEKEIKAIVFIIGGYGANANIYFLDSYRNYIAKNFDVVAVHVFYHCFCARQSIDQKYNPKLIPNKDDLERINNILKNINLGHLLANEDNFEQIIPFIEQRAGEIKQAGLVDESVSCFLKTHWTRKENSPYFFNNENYFIRTLLNKDHLILQSQKNKNIIYVSYHSKEDPLTPANFKEQTMQILKILGYDVSLNLIDENKIDGKFIKNLDHGCGIPDKALFRKELPLMLEKLQGRKSFMQENSISYPCGNKVFTFKDVGDKFELEIKD